MKLFKQLVQFFKFSEIEKDIVDKEIGAENIRRVFYLSAVIIPASIIHILIFGLKLNSTSGIEHQWRLGIITAHLLIVIVLSSISAVAYIKTNKSDRKNNTVKVLIHFLFFLLPIIGGAIASIDQMVTNAITPFLVACLLAGLIFLIKPFYAILSFTLGYLVFLNLISLNQLDPDVLDSNRVNGITAAAIGLCLSIVFWQGNLTRLKQSRIIEDQNLKLKAGNAEKDKFFSIIGHDLKNSFNSILGFSNLITEDLKIKDLDRLEKHADILNASTISTYKLLENLLEWAKSQTGNMTFNPERFDLNSLINEKIEEYRIPAKAKEIELNFRKGEDIFIVADINMLKTIIRNLISNAIKYTRPGGFIEVQTFTNSSVLEISVTDNGIGLTDSIKDQLFKLSANATREGTANEKGTGLGLLLCKELVEKHGGKIWAESSDEKGSRFIFTIPLDE